MGSIYIHVHNYSGFHPEKFSWEGKLYAKKFWGGKLQSCIWKYCSIEMTHNSWLFGGRKLGILGGELPPPLDETLILISQKNF